MTLTADMRSAKVIVYQFVSLFFICIITNSTFVAYDRRCLFQTGHLRERAGGTECLGVKLKLAESSAFKSLACFLIFKKQSQDSVPIGAPFNLRL